MASRTLTYSNIGRLFEKIISGTASMNSNLPKFPKYADLFLNFVRVAKHLNIENIISIFCIWL